MTRIEEMGAKPGCRTRYYIDDIYLIEFTSCETPSDWKKTHNIQFDKWLGFEIYKADEKEYGGWKSIKSPAEQMYIPNPEAKYPTKYLVIDFNWVYEDTLFNRNLLINKILSVVRKEEE